MTAAEADLALLLLRWIEDVLTWADDNRRAPGAVFHAQDPHLTHQNDGQVMDTVRISGDQVAVS